jgi:hypothetical protein
VATHQTGEKGRRIMLSGKEIKVVGLQKMVKPDALGAIMRKDDF